MESLLAEYYMECAHLELFKPEIGEYNEGQGEGMRTLFNRMTWMRTLQFIKQ